ncbi:hypothetical protein QQ045_019006 [Rhodiola kirilowii]
MGIVVDGRCVLCGLAEECLDHLFFACQAARVWRGALEYLRVTNGPAQWHLLIPWYNARMKDALETRFIAAAITRTIYEIWKMRNKRLIAGEEVDVQKSCREIICGLRMK